MKVLVIDGMGGSIGSQIVSRLREALPEETEIEVLGTNAVATANMMKAGANRGASGENAFRVTAPGADLIIGPVGISIPDSFMGELSPAMAEAVSLSPAKKLLLPLTQPGIEIVGAKGQPLPHLLDEAVELIKLTLGIEEVKERV
ncbi:MAG: DUF3842 family protein [Actinobacteria bacterium]|nr:DUF3842 family protein [Actinomycetota bacterium]